ncbi:MAG: hypothetical protein J3R72DRAFT_637 [Linnemannia gamsii]|nr:MAG: hypothetical protein J3R72DRAFT_637 [Linnemannia gamsii]
MTRVIGGMGPMLLATQEDVRIVLTKKKGERVFISIEGTIVVIVGSVVDLICVLLRVEQDGTYELNKGRASYCFLVGERETKKKKTFKRREGRSCNLISFLPSSLSLCSSLSSLSSIFLLTLLDCFGLFFYFHSPAQLYPYYSLPPISFITHDYQLTLQHSSSQPVPRSSWLLHAWPSEQKKKKETKACKIQNNHPSIEADKHNNNINTPSSTSIADSLFPSNCPFPPRIPCLVIFLCHLCYFLSLPFSLPCLHATCALCPTTTFTYYVFFNSVLSYVFWGDVLRSDLLRAQKEKKIAESCCHPCPCHCSLLSFTLSPIFLQCMVWLWKTTLYKSEKR